MSKNYNNIVVPVDPAHDSSWREALPIAIDLALQHQATLHLVTVVPDADVPAIAVHLPKGVDQRIRDKGRDDLETLLEREVPKSVLTAIAVGQGRIDKQILRLAREAKADLIVMASHRPRATDYLISANAAYVTRHAKCSVMVVRETPGEE